MSTNHTPGLWTYSFQSVDPEWAVVTAPGGVIIANVNADGRQVANAKLIAAAPDLLQVLQEFSDAFDGVIAQGGHSVTIDDQSSGWVSLVRAAIAKATGESS